LETSRENLLGKIKDIEYIDRLMKCLRELNNTDYPSIERKTDLIVSNELLNMVKKYKDYLPEDSLILRWEINPRDVQVVKSLGRGTSGEVFEGRYMNQIVAIKELFYPDTKDSKDEFIKEFTILVNIKSPYIVSFYGATIIDTPRMVMEFCENGSLFHVLSSEIEMDWDFTLRIMSEIVKGLKALHNNTPIVIHRDLKTLNVLVTKEYHCKLADFGLSRFDTSTNLESLRECKGTYAYIAPEAFNGSKSSIASDIYSVGIITWEIVNRLIKGKYEFPFHEYNILNEISILYQTNKEGLRPTLPALPPNFVDLVGKCWNHKRKKRPQSIKLLELIKQLEREYKEGKEEWNKYILKPSKE